MADRHGTKRMTFIVLRGSVIVTVALTSLLIVHGIFSHNLHVERILFGLTIILYFLVGERLIQLQKHVVVGWMIMSFFITLSIAMLLCWGLNTPVGILSIGFSVFLAGVMLGPRYIGWVIGIIASLLCVVQIVHQLEIIKPKLQILSEPSDIFDVIAYITILSFFALLSWLSGRQTEKSLERAHKAEERVRNQKNELAAKLEEETRLLHQAKLHEMVRFYKFVDIGRSTVITLHELSNLLSVLSLDIDDISHRYQRSKAIINAKQGIEQINHLVHQTRQQLNNNQNKEVFNIISAVDHTFKEIKGKYITKGVKLTKKVSPQTPFKVMGDILVFSHVLTILLNNALDACVSKKNGHVSVMVEQKENLIRISVQDNGDGISENDQKILFQPQSSTKPNGLGIGLYITKHIVESQFHGKIFTAPSDQGALFVVELPRYIN